MLPLISKNQIKANMEVDKQELEISDDRDLSISIVDGLANYGPIIILVAFLMHLGAVYFATYPVTNWGQQSLERFGQLGDSFGILTSTFTALAAWVAIVLLKQNRADMKEARCLMQSQLQQSKIQSELVAKQIALDEQQLIQVKAELNQSRIQSNIERVRLQPEIEIRGGVLSYDGVRIENTSENFNLGRFPYCTNNKPSKFYRLRFLNPKGSGVHNPFLVIPNINRRSESRIYSPDIVTPYSFDGVDSDFVINDSSLHFYNREYEIFFLSTDQSGLSTIRCYKLSAVRDELTFRTEYQGLAYLDYSIKDRDLKLKHEEWKDVYESRI
jgi:hypothetical protein